jgi:hypothetical protein
LNPEGVTLALPGAVAAVWLQAASGRAAKAASQRGRGAVIMDGAPGLMALRCKAKLAAI